MTINAQHTDPSRNPIAHATVSSPARLTALALEEPDRPAVTDDTDTITRSELDRRTNQLARRFAALGVTAGSMVSIALPNSIRHLESSIAAWKLGAIPQPLSHRLPRDEMERILEVADPALVVGLEPPNGRPWFDGDADVSQESGAPLPDIVSPAWKAPTSGGSTGTPKLIVSGQQATIEGVLRRADALRLDRNGVILTTAPMYHNAPNMFSLMALLQGHHVVLMRRFDAERTLRLITEFAVTWLYVVPTMMGRILRLPEEIRRDVDVSTLRTVLHVGAPCPEKVKRGWLDWIGPEKVWELYSGTEAQASCMIDGNEWLAHPGSVGRVGSGAMSVRDGAFEPVSAGTVGEIWMRPEPGTPATYRYLGAHARTRDGWDSLGDMGYFDEDGYLYLTDRISDMILVGGANVYPAEIESALAEHSAVLTCAVIGLPDEDLGNTVHAVVQSAHPVSEDEILDHLRTRLVSYKLPRSVEFSDTPLRDDAGKVRRGALREARLRTPAS
ncbi:bile acid-coenzyme A ligase [Rhodococcus wratislaviensis]|uniref:Long-chain-fatty-acid--CoA ligase n=1 Tax=Rhodococcus wratislaviensis TaxID=44752 RepID=A0AB38FCD7_RHOWR|nr:AMP-binding protein [Rhodococcus wratislaviensis]REE75691.1 bile acid-coenzyme A ligase [Rhodococcus wratislaviensis]SPZ39270.1 long-chain-fatty-acid--CoA ligase [Rhodococcus wratislaviensis]